MTRIVVKHRRLCLRHLPVAATSGQRGGGERAAEALHDADWDVRWSAAESLGQVGAGNEAVVSALLEALHDADSAVRTSAAGSLGQVGAGNEAVVSALLEALHDADSACGSAAGAWAGGSGQRGGGERAAGGPARCRLGCAEGAAGSLGQVGVGNEAVVSALLEALHDADLGCGRVRQRAWARWERATRRW